MRTRALVPLIVGALSLLPTPRPLLGASPKTGTIRGTITVTDAKGKQVDATGAVVYVIGFDEDPPDAVPKIVQKDKKFSPDLLAITAGQKVSFPNKDPILHNVFSVSPARPFDLGQYKKGREKTKSFPEVGVVDVYCNIHPEMAATILVLPNRRHARVGADGTFVLAGVPAGKRKVFAYTKLAKQPVSVEVEVKADDEVSAALTLVRGDPVTHTNKYGEAYRGDEYE